MNYNENAKNEVIKNSKIIVSKMWRYFFLWLIQNETKKRGKEKNKVLVKYMPPGAQKKEILATLWKISYFYSAIAVERIVYTLLLEWFTKTDLISTNLVNLRTIACCQTVKFKWSPNIYRTAAIDACMGCCSILLKAKI